MKKTLLFLTGLLLSIYSYSQVVSIVPNFAVKGQTLTTIITTANGVMSMASPPMGTTDIYLQKGATIIYVDAFDPNINIYPGIGGPWNSPYSDSMHVAFTIPLSVPSGMYDVHVISYAGAWPQFPQDNVLTSGFTIIGGIAGTIEGDVYFDYNQNGIRDVNDNGIANQRINVTPGNFMLYTDANGHYRAALDTGTYTVTPNIPIGFSLTTANASYNASIPPSSFGNDFGLFSFASITDQDFSVWHHPIRCQPADGYTYVTQHNNGNVTVQGSITIIHSPNFPFDYSSPAPDVISGDTVTWYYNNLAPGQTLTLGAPYIAFNSPPAGQTIWYSVYDSIYTSGSVFLGTLRDTFSFVVTCSCDPNEKMVSPPGVTAQNYLPMSTPLNFTVNFQNTGNDTAFTVIVLDTLDSDLDLTTFQILGSSDEVSTQMDANGALSFTFNNILLPDSNIDEPGSHGFVNYRISPKSGLSDPTPITNTAYIYFDLNSAVITNTSLATLTNLQYPSASFAVVDPTICQNNCIVFTDQSTSASSYAWTFQGGNPSTSTSANPGVVCYNTSGQFNVQLIVTNALGSDTLVQPQYIDVSPSPTGLSVTQAGDTLWANAGYDVYQWFYENDSIQGATGNYYIAQFSGNYGIIVANANGCTAGLNIPNVISAVSELIDSRGTSIFPNPTSGEFELALSAFEKSNASIEIINSMGQIMSIKNIQIYSGINRISFDTSDLAEGLYSIRILSGNQTISKQLLKIK